MRNIYHKVVQETESGLSVAIGRNGIRVSEATCCTGLIDNLPDGDILVVTNTFSWQQVKNRQRCYSGDDSTGSMAHCLVSAAISLIGYYGGNEDFIETIDQFQEAN